MGALSSLVAVGIVKGLAKLIVKSADGGVIAEAIAVELAGAGAKRGLPGAIRMLTAFCIDPVDDHPEFRGLAENERESVRLEVETTIGPAIDRTFLGTPPFDSKRVVAKLFRIRADGGSPVGLSERGMAFFQHSVDAAVRAIIAVAENAKEWHAANAAEIHSKLDDLSESLQMAARTQAQVLSVLDYAEQSLAEIQADQFRSRRDFLERYYRTICKTLDRMELYGLDVDLDNPARSQRLSVAYISLNLTSKEEASKGSQSWESILDTLRPGEMGRLLVRGDAGMGKTTLLRWAAISLASQFNMPIWEGVRTQGDGKRQVVIALEFHGPVDKEEFTYGRIRSWRDKVPLLITLRECPDGRLPPPQDFPSFVSPMGGKPPDGFIEWLLSQGKALVLIDGLDEIAPGEASEAASKSITELLQIDGEAPNLFIATSRPLVKDPAWIKSLKFREAVIAPMTDTERDLLIHKWHDAVAERTEDQDRRVAVLAMPKDLIDQLNQRPEVARLASVPLLCAMICAQSGPLGSKLPGSEFGIINKLAEAMLWARDRDRKVPPSGTPWDDLEDKKRLAVVARLAHFLVREGRPVVPREAAEQKIADALRFAGQSDADAKRNAGSVLNRMGDRGGVVRAPADGPVEFAHKTFCEFLSAFQFVEDQDARFLGEHAPEPGPANVCRYTAGVSNRKYTEELIARVLDGKDAPEARAVIALRMRSAAPTLDPAVRDRVQAVADKMIPPKTRAESYAIAELGDEIVPRLVFTPDATVGQHVLNALSLVQIRSRHATKVLASYAPSATKMALIELLCRVLNPLSIPFLQRSLCTYEVEPLLELPASIRERINDEALAEWLCDARLPILNLGDTQVTDEGVETLAAPESDLKAITMLDLSGTRVTDKGVKALADAGSGLKDLAGLRLRGTQVTDEGVEALAAPKSGLKALRTLNLGDTRVTDKGVKALSAPESGLKTLTTLDLSRTRVTDEGVKAMVAPESCLKALTTLDLSRTRVRGRGMKALAAPESGLKALTWLYLKGTVVTRERGMALRAARPGLRVLQ
jgi:hypothetical protein